jgi:hypothetical protein
LRRVAIRCPEIPVDALGSEHDDQHLLPHLELQNTIDRLHAGGLDVFVVPDLAFVAPKAEEARRPAAVGRPEDTAHVSLGSYAAL